MQKECVLAYSVRAFCERGKKQHELVIHPPWPFQIICSRRLLPANRSPHGPRDVASQGHVAYVGGIPEKLEEASRHTQRLPVSLTATQWEET